MKETTTPRYLKTVSKYSGMHRNLGVNEYFDTNDLRALEAFSKYGTWERLKSEVSNFDNFFIEVSEEEYNKAKGIVPVVNNTFPIY